VATGFAASALAAGDRILYVTAGSDTAAIGRMLAAGGVDAGEPLTGGQLLVSDLAGLGGSPDGIDLAGVLAAYRAEAVRSRAAGFPGLRIAVEMSDLVAVLGSAEAVVRWEGMAGGIFDEMGITALCQYDAGWFDAPDRADITAVHGAVGVDDGTMPMATFVATPTDGLQVAGELDVATKPFLARALRARAAVAPSLHVDLGGVTFADVGGLRTFFEVARELPPGRELVLHRPTAQLQRLLGLVGWEDGRLRVDSS
jgi:anti-anti-sigma regulatory factor